MTREPNEVEQALARTVRSSLDRFQRTAEELQHAVNDLVAACSSARVANTLPPMMRAQMSAASLAASLEALSRFVTLNLPPALAAEPAASWRPSEPVAVPVSGPEPPAEPDEFEPAEAPAAPQLESLLEPEAVLTAEPVLQQSPASENAAEAGPEIPPEAPAEMALETVAPLEASELLLVQEQVPVELESQPAGSVQFTEFPDFASAPAAAEALPQEAFRDRPSGFDISALPAEVQELHRRANRVAKVSMQDIKLLRPEDVRLGQQHRDLCFRLREDLERARKEYDRRFQMILDHPVDYFYDWLVEILADGDPQLLGEYPYPSAALRR